ncbi:MAG: hypothetical protein D6732_29100 [Methanobacteriota archaeon]|nr:MAG: hypothetical protein D6732_29100 [Euryarchaeota archaeon]
MTISTLNGTLSLEQTEFFGETEMSPEEFQKLLEQFTPENGFQVKKLRNYYFIENFGEPFAVIRYFKGKIRLIENFMRI